MWFVIERNRCIFYPEQRFDLRMLYAGLERKKRRGRAHRCNPWSQSRLPSSERQKGKKASEMSRWFLNCHKWCSFRHGGSCMRWGWMIVFRLTAVAFQTCPLWDCLGGRVSEKKKGRKGSGRKHWELPWWECQCGLPDQIGSGEQHNHFCGSCSSCNLWPLGFGEGPGILAS